MNNGNTNYVSSSNDDRWGHRPTGTHSGPPMGCSGWVQDRVSYRGQLQATVQVHGLFTQLDVDGLSCSSLPVAGPSAPLHSGTIPVNHVLRLMGLDRNTILWVSTFHRLLVSQAGGETWRHILHNTCTYALHTYLHRNLLLERCAPMYRNGR